MPRPLRLLYLHVRHRVRMRLLRIERAKVRKGLQMPVDRAPDPKTLDSLGQERLQTHIRTRADLH